MLPDKDGNEKLKTDAVAEFAPTVAVVAVYASSIEAYEPSSVAAEAIATTVTEEGIVTTVVVVAGIVVVE